MRMKSFIRWMLTAVLLSAGMTGLQAQTPVWDGSVAESFAGGTGKADDPYLIETPAQLAKLAKDVNARNAYDSAYFRLENDLDLGGGNGLRWEPIGCGSQYAQFNGHFDGNYKHIKGLYVNDTNPKSMSMGLFGTIGSSHPNISQASVKRLIVSGKIDVTLPRSTGMVGSMMSGTLVEDCISLLDIVGERGASATEGGIVGSNTGTVRRCIFGGSVRNGFRAGGIAGMNGGRIEEVMNFGYIERNGSQGYAGGIAGSCDGAIYHAFNSGSVLSNKTAGGIVGSFNGSSDGVLADCLNVGYVYGRGAVGAVLGNGNATGRVYYDVQTASGLMAGENYHDGNYNQRVLTRRLISGDASACEFSVPEKWTFKAGSYPAVKSLMEHENAMMAALAALAAVPVVTPDPEAWVALKSGFTVGVKITTADGEKTVNWGTDMPGLVSFSGNKGTLQRPGTDTVVSFYAEVGGLPVRRQVRFDHYKIYEDLKAPAYKEAVAGKKIYEISEFAHLAWVNAIANGVIYMAAEEYAAAMPKYTTFTGAILDIKADIDMGGYNWIPMAGCGFASRYFGGYIRGNGHALQNLTIDRPGEDNIGFIGFLGGQGSGVENLRLVGGQVTNQDSYAGALVGFAYLSDIKRCINESCTVKNGWVAGGLAGRTQGTYITQCANWADVMCSGSFAGGLAGIFNSDNNRTAHMDESYNKGAVYAKEGAVGGLTGMIGSEAQVRNGFNAGAIGGDKDQMGGIAGGLSVDAVLENCYNVGKVTKPAGVIGQQRIGDVLGVNGSQYLINNYYNKEINGIGGVAEADCEGVEALTTADMQNNWKMIAMLDGNLWCLDEEGINDGYPIFLWMTETAGADNEDLAARAASALTLRVYPNPASETVYVEEADLCELAVYRLTGQRVLHRSGRDLRSLDVSGLPAGLYVLRATDGEGRVYASKLNVINH